MEPPPPRPTTVTFVALLLGFLGAAQMAFALGAIPPTAAEFPGGVGLAVGVALVVANVALLVGAIGLWWMRGWGLRVAVVGLGLRIVHGAFFAFAAGHEAQRGPNTFSVIVHGLAILALLSQRRRFAG